MIRFGRLHPTSPAPVWASLGVTGLGFGAILFAWSLVAGTDNASDQIAPLLGFGLGGLAVVAAGTTLLALAVKQRDNALIARGAGTALTTPRPHAWVEIAAAVTAVVGVASIALAIIGARTESETEFVRPYLASGGLGGLALLVVAAGLLLVRRRRRTIVRAHRTRVAEVALAASLALVALTPLFASDRADAAEANPPPVPLQRLAPVLAVAGPAAGGVCGGLGVVALLAPGLLGDSASTVLPLIGPAFVVCGAIPGTPPIDKYTCALDTQSLALIGAVTSLAGVPPALDIRPIAQILETLGAAADLVLPPKQVDAALEQPSIVLQCTHGPAAETPLTAPPGSPAAPLPTASFDNFPLPLSELPFASGPLVGSVAGPTINPPASAGFATPLGRVPFSYAAVFVLPFLLLLGGAGIGKAVLSPIPFDDPETDPRSEPRPA